MTYKCKQCCDRFVPKAKDRTTFCGRECSFKYLRLNGKLPKSKRVLIARHAVSNGAFVVLCHWKVCDRCKFYFYARNKNQNVCARNCLGRCRFCYSQYRRENKSQQFCSDICRRNSSRDSKHLRKTYRERAELFEVQFDKTVKRTAVFERDNYRCHLCGRIARNATVDHITPMSRGGGHTWDNVATACFKCNSRKWTMTLDEYRALYGVCQKGRGVAKNIA